VFRVGSQNGRLDLNEILKTLSAESITRLMVEGGPTIAASFVEADLVDAVALFHADKTIGDDGIDALEGLPLAALTASDTLRKTGEAAFGSDRLDTYERA
jgi:diaminohydroxyphosphoribosylaminopyrimidine deaminase/5-amino-6-(5-phosphoribosylamino)uracil reductase